MDLGITDHVAIVTGGTQGIGNATAAKLVAEGARVAIAARDQTRLDAAVSELAAIARDRDGRRVLGVAADVGRAADCERLVAATIDAFGRLDILVNNAGTSAAGPFMDATDAQWQADLDTKLFAAIRLIRLAVPHMRAVGGGRIVNLTNIGAKQPRAKSVPTSVTRAAGLALTKALSKELAPDKILVNTVCIGLVRAGQHETRAAKLGRPVEALYAEMAKEIPLGRVGEAEEVANVIAFLVSARASFVTGSSVNLDGGASGVL
jgi:3-oxoacyl-[acyl-carrier protein] reductase